MKKKLKKIEAKNLSEAVLKSLQYLNNFNRKKLHIPGSFFLMLHKILLANDTRNAGKYRTKLFEIEINGKTFEPSKAWQIENHIIDLVELINNKRKWPSIYKKYFKNIIKNIDTFDNTELKLTYKVFIAWYFHHKLVTIHPFSDGNGRMARLLMCLILRYEGLSNVSYPVLLNFIINKNKQKYLDALNAADKGNYIVGVNYMYSVLSKAYRETVKEGAK